MKIATVIVVFLALIIYFLGWGSSKSSFPSWNIAPNFRGVAVKDPRGGNYFQNKRGLWVHYYFLPAYKSSQAHANSQGLPLAKATLAVLHGLGGYNEGFLSLCDKLSQAGLDVYAMEYAGWGHSEGERGYFGENGVEDVAWDFNSFLEFIEDKQTKNANLNRIVCLGKSMGGLAVLHSTLHYNKCQDGSVLLAPAVQFHEQQSGVFERIVLPALAKIFPKIPIRFESNWEVMLRAASRQSLRNYMANDIASLQKRLESQATSSPKILFLQGGADNVTEPSALKSFASRAQSLSNNRIVYDELPGLGHELETVETVHQTVLSWFWHNILGHR